MITCRELTDFLMAYLDGDLSPLERAEFERHLAVCPPCVAYLDTYKQTIQIGKSVCGRPDDPLPRDIPEDLIKAILAARDK